VDSSTLPVRGHAISNWHSRGLRAATVVNRGTTRSVVYNIPTESARGPQGRRCETTAGGTVSEGEIATQSRSANDFSCSKRNHPTWGVAQGLKGNVVAAIAGCSKAQGPRPTAIEANPRFAEAVYSPGVTS
jgi:hypothetical protein